MRDGQKNVLVTGASRGIGRATAELFHERGWRVLTISRSPAEGTVVGEFLSGDLSDLTALPEVIRAVKTRLASRQDAPSRLDALVNNAGISPKAPGGQRLGLLATDAATWMRVLNTNLVAGALLARALMPELQAARGAIVNVTSIAGRRVHPFAGAAYAASKAGLAALTRELAVEFGGHGVRTNAVSPGEIQTSILSPGTDTLVEREVPMGRLGLPREVAEAIFFLASPQAAYINGMEMEINGGQSS